MSALPAETSSRARIFDAALTVFSRYGYRRASMEAVAAEANLSRQGLYRHFASKEVLFAAVIETMHDFVDGAAERALSEARAAQKSSGEALGAMVAAKMEAYASRVLGSPHAAELMEVSNRIGGATIAARAAAAEAALARAIAAERSAGRLTLKRGITPAELASLLTAAANGAKYGAVQPPDVLGARVKRIVALMVDGARA